MLDMKKHDGCPTRSGNAGSRGTIPGSFNYAETMP